MRRGLKWAGAGLGIVLLLVAALLAVAWAHFGTLPPTPPRQ